MAVTTRSLALGLTGSDVAALQTQLAQLGLPVPATEQEAASYGQGTHDVVAQFQTAHGLPATGVVDAATATAVSEAVAEASYTVNGAVSSPTSAGVGGLNVRLVDKNVGADVPLGATTTQADGSYTVTAVIAVPALQQRHKTRPDLQVRVSAGTTFLAASSVAYDAAATVTLDVALPPDASLPSEYETLTTSLAGLYTGKLGALQETDQRQDITFLANKSKWDARLVATAALADQFSQITVPAPPAAPGLVAPPPVSLKPEFYYALFRAGLPANADTLFQAGATAVQEVWQQAVAQGVIPNALATGIADAVKSFQALSAAHALTAAPPVGPSTLQAMLQATLPGATQQQQFAQLCAQYREDRATFWTQVTASFGTATAQQLQFNGQLYYLTLNNAPLVSALATAEKLAPLASALDLALRGYHDPAKWTPLIGNSIPSQIPGATADAQRANYANLLATQVRIAFPTAVVADLVQRGTFPPATSTTKAADVAAFLTANAATFDIGTEPVEAYIVRAKLAGASAPVVAEIKRLQRVRQITPDDQSMAILIQHQLDSAYAITRYDLAGFTRAFQDKLGGADIAAQIHARARQIYGAVLNVATSYLIARRSPATGGASPLIIPFSAPSPNPPYPVVAYPTLENLFGSLDYCNCEECRSILSPAAYLVDLLNSIDIPVPSSGYQNPLTALLQRRPDLQYLPLSCANTNTALPYIDLVNETLEYFVANSLSLAGYQGFDTGSMVTSAELMANPQNVNQAAYTALQGQFFPPPLPFDRSLALLRLHLQKIGVALPELMAALRPSDAIERGAAPYGWRDILLEQLAISREEYRLFTDGTLKLQGLYGYPSLSDPAVLTTLRTTSLRDLSRRIGVSYDDLFAIVATRFINPNANLIPKVERLNAPFAALQALKNGVGDPSIVASFKAALPAGLDARPYGGSTPTDYEAIVRWVTDGANYARIMGIITISNPTNSADQCSATALELRYANPENTANALTATDFVKLMRFIRLWRKLGLGISQTDAILSALYPAADLPTGANDAANLPLLDAGFALLLPRIGFLMQVMKALGLTPAAGLAQLLACWATIDTTGTGSLYARMFLSPTLLQPDPAFADDGYGNFLGSGAEPLLNHQSTLCAAFCITGAEFDLITGSALPGSLGFGPTTALTLANVSAVFRVGWLAHALGISVREFVLLRYCTGLDPFALLDPASPPPAEPPVIRFIRLVRALAAAGIRPVQALYLMWNRDISGNSAPSTEAVTSLALDLRAAFAAVEAQFTLVDDPDGSIAKQMMGLVYDSATTDFFFGLLNNTFITSVACAAGKPMLAQPITDASSGRLSYDDLRKQLSFAGVLDPATQAAIDQAITNNGSDPALHDALARLGTSNKQAVDLFFATYRELLPLFSTYVAATGTVQDRRKGLLAGLLPDLTRRRKRLQALTSITGAAGADPSFAIALLQDASIMHAAADGTAAAASDLTAIEAGGLTARFFLTNNIAANPDQTVDCAPSLSYGAGTANPLPSGSGGSPIAATWSGYLDVPQDGFYNIAVTADAGATITLRIAGTAVAMAASGNVWNNQAPISLTAGSLAPIVLTATSVKTTMTVSWESQGLGSQPISSQYLYAGMLIDRLRSTYVGFLKATALATALSLTAREITWLGTATSFAVNTDDGRDKLAAGNATFTPSSMSNIKVGSKLVIDSGAAQEAVTVTAVTGTTFRAVTTRAHDGTGVPFHIVSQAFPALGQGWLSFLSASTATPTTSASLRDVLSALVTFSRIKLAVSPRDERLLAVMQNPALTLANGSSALLALTGWSRDSLAALLQQFFGGTQLAGLSDVENFRRVHDAYAFVNACRITAAVLIAGTTNAPSSAVVAALQSALRALYADTDWLTAVRPINDAIRIQQRDALVACILQQLGDGNGQAPSTATTTADAPAGSTVLALANTGGIVVGMSARGANIAAGATVAAVGGSTVTISAVTLADVPSGSSLTFVQDTSAINTADKLFEYFLIDPQTQPPVDTSRIRLALSSVQLFIERVLRNLEPQVQPADLQTLASQWQWMRRYRVWQANREVFLWPENWLYPELRDDPSPLFQQTMRNLLQGDITDDAAAEAYLDYLTGLEAIAKLEPCGLFHVPAAPGGDEAAYVVARTAGAHRKYYFRELEHSAWTPWTEVKIDCEDMPLTPIVWNDRLFLFWLTAVKTTVPQTMALPSGNITNMDLGTLHSAAQTAVAAQGAATVSAVLHWCEYCNGKWQPSKTSELGRPTALGTFPTTGPDSFDVDRNLLRIVPVQLVSSSPVTIPSDALILAIGSPHYPSWPSGGFVLYNTHSLPIRFEDITGVVDIHVLNSSLTGHMIVPLSWFVASPSRGRTLAPIQPYTGGNTSTPLSIAYWTSPSGPNSPVYDNDLIGLNWLPRTVEPQIGTSDAWDAPFLFEDRQNAFYVTTSLSHHTIRGYNGFGILSTTPSLVGSVAKIPPLMTRQAAAPGALVDSIVTGNVVGGGDPTAIKGYLKQSMTIRTAVGSTGAVFYQGRPIYPGGSASNLPQPRST